MHTFLTPPAVGADFRAAFVANCFRGALPPVDLRAVCLVLAIFDLSSVVVTTVLPYCLD